MMTKELGATWQDNFLEFDQIPFAAASIGQVHKAKLLDGTVVAVKVQYPGVKQSITSDLSNLKALILLSNFLPKGLYLENTIRVAQKELIWECDYKRELDCMERFGLLLQNDKYLKVPRVFRNISTEKVLVSEFVPGFPIGKATSLPQHKRDQVRIVIQNNL